MSLNQRLDKQAEIYSYIAILACFLKEQTTHTHIKIEEFQKTTHPDTIDYTTYVSIYMKFWNRQTHLSKKF